MGIMCALLVPMIPSLVYKTTFSRRPDLPCQCHSKHQSPGFWGGDGGGSVLCEWRRDEYAGVALSAVWGVGWDAAPHRCYVALDTKSFLHVPGGGRSPSSSSALSGPAAAPSCPALTVCCWSQRPLSLLRQRVLLWDYSVCPDPKDLRGETHA